jgi:predicted nucleic acid-binding protein
MIVCSNTTPFIALASVRLLELLPQMFIRVHVPASVVSECAVGGGIAVPPLSLLEWVVVHPNPEGTLVGVWDLDAGEKDAILLALQLKADRILMDERLGRNMAEYQGLNVMGTLGVLAKAKKVGLIPSFAATAEIMRQQGIRYSQDLVNRISHHLGE